MDRRILIDLAIISGGIFLSIKLHSSDLSVARGKNVLTLNFVGDIMLGRQVGKAIINNDDSCWPFRDIYSEINSADLLVGNLECVFVDKIITGTINYKKILFPAYGESVRGLKLAGFDVVSLANNHSLDFGIKGVEATKKILEADGIKCAGIDSTDPVVVMKKDFKIAIFGYWMNRGDLYRVNLKEGYRKIERNVFIDEIRNTRKLSDIVIIFIHWGKEFTSYPIDSQRSIAHLAIDSGADLVVGHGPHQIQGIERYRNGFIAYSLGNFVFDQKYEETKSGIILCCYFSQEKSLLDTMVTPVIIPEYIYKVKLAPRLEKEKLLQRLFEISKKLNTKRNTKHLWKYIN